MRTVRNKVASLAFVLLSALSPALSDDASRLEVLEQKLRDLERQVAELRAAAPAEPERLQEIERRIEIVAREIENLKLGEASPAAEQGVYGLGPAASKVYASRRGVSIGGYGEGLYQNFDPSDEAGAPSGETDQIDLLRLVLYVGYKFNDRILFNSELEFEHATTGEGAEEKGEASVEFAYLDFLLRKGLNVRSGLMLVPMGFLNELHEPPVFLGARRPFVEQILIPTTWREIGAGVFGEAGPLTYRAYLVTSLAAVSGTSSGAQGFEAEGIREGRSGGSNAAAQDFALTGRLDWKPTRGLGLGAALFTGDTGQGRRAPTSGERIDARTTLVDAHVEYRWRGLEARALYVRTSIGDAGLINDAQGITGAESVGERQVGVYGQLGYDVLSSREGTRQALIPYVRWERFNTQDRVPSGFAADPANEVTVSTLGVAWKPIDNIAMKADYNRIENEARTGVDQVNVALGMLF